MRSKVVSMSIEAMNFAYSQTVGSPTRKAVLVTLANMADHQGKCFPSIQYIANRTELTTRSVQLNLRQLESAGFIRTLPRKGKTGNKSNVYVIDLSGVNVIQEGVNITTLPPEPNAPITIINNQLTNKNIYTDGFNRWWSTYPNKTGKKPAFAIWKRINPPVDLLIQHTTQSALSDRRWLPDSKGETYIPNPTTYLNQERWNDEIQRAATAETGFERTARMANEYLSNSECDEYSNGQALDLDGRALPSPVD